MTFWTYERNNPVQEVWLPKSIYLDPTHPLSASFGGRLYNTREEAVAKQREMAAKRIASLKKQIAKLEALL